MIKKKTRIIFKKTKNYSLEESVFNQAQSIWHCQQFFLQFKKNTLSFIKMATTNGF